MERTFYEQLLILGRAAKEQERMRAGDVAARGPRGDRSHPGSTTKQPRALRALRTERHQMSNTWKGRTRRRVFVVSDGPISAERLEADRTGLCPTCGATMGEIRRLAKGVFAAQMAHEPFCSVRKEGR